MKMPESWPLVALVNETGSQEQIRTFEDTRSGATGQHHDRIKNATSAHTEMQDGGSTVVERTRSPSVGTSTHGLMPPTSGSTGYKVYKRRWFGLIQLVLLNIVVSWDVRYAPLSPRFKTDRLQ